MAEEPDNIVLVMLRKMDAKLDRVVEDLQDLKVRVTAVEAQFASVDQRFASVELALAGVQGRIDRVDRRLDRIEKRLDLVDGPYGGVRE